LKWSWGIIPTLAVKDVPEGGEVQEESTGGVPDIDSRANPSDEEAPRTPKLSSSQPSDSETVTSTPTTIGLSQQTSGPSVAETLLATPQKTHQLSQMTSSNACANLRAPTETSRIRLYFNSPVELEDRPALHVAPTVDQPNQHQQRRGGKRKKEHEEGEPEEGSKRKKEDNDSTTHHTHVLPPQPSNESVMKASDQDANGNTHPRNEATLEPSGIGAKRKAPSFSGDEEDGDGTHKHDHDRPLIVQNEPPKTKESSRLEADHDAETEYAGSPPHDVFLEYPEPPHSVFSTAEGEGEGEGEGEDEEIISASQAPTEVADSDPHEQHYYASENDGPDAPHEDNVSAASEIEGNMPADSDVRSHDELSAQLCDDSLRAVDGACLLNQDSRKTTDSSVPVQTSSAPIDAPTTHQPVNPVPTVTVPVGQTPSPNRISISYAGSSRRLVLDTEIVQRVRIFRAEGRIEVRFVLEHVESPPSFPVSAPGLASSAKLDAVASSTGQDSTSEPAVQPRPLVASDATTGIGLSEGCTGNNLGDASVVASESPDKISSESSADANVEHVNGVVETSSARLANLPASPRSALQSAESCLQSHAGMVRCRGILASSHLSLSSSPEGATRRWCAHHSDILHDLFISFRLLHGRGGLVSWSS
jgi:20S proteasome subunit alpha 6